MNLCTDTFEVDINYFLLIFRASGGRSGREILAVGGEQICGDKDGADPMARRKKWVWIWNLDEIAAGEWEAIWDGLAELCEGLRRADWDAVLGARDKGEGGDRRRAQSGNVISEIRVTLFSL